jgi:hypothetical protein
MSKFPPLNTISLYHSSLGALEQPGEVNITPQLGSWTSRHSRTPTQKRAHFGYLLTDAAGNSAVPPEWITSKVSLDEIEGPDRAPDLSKPSDCPEWRSFKSGIMTGDELWHFTSPPDSFRHGAGRMGYVIIRNRNQANN